MGAYTQNEDKTLVMARIESTIGQDAIAAALGTAPSPYATDPMLVSAADVSVQASTLERNNYSASLSPDNIGIGRMLQQVTFTHEFRTSGVFGTPPRLGRLLRACGFQETIVPNTAAAIIQNPVNGPGNSANAMATTWAKGAVIPTKDFDTYRVYVTQPGKYILAGAGFSEGDGTVMVSTVHAFNSNSALGSVLVGGTVQAPTYALSGTFVVNDIVEIFVGGVRFYYQVLLNDTPAIIATALANLIKADGRYAGTASAAGTITVGLSGAAAEQNLVSGTAITLGASGAQVTPTTGGALVAGDYFDIPMLRPGVRYDPITDNIPTVTLYVYMDGTLHRATAARGTFTMTANAGEYPTLAFTFTGQYNEPIDAVLPSTLVQFEKSKPYRVELAEASVLGMPNVCAQAFTMDLAGAIAPKDCINAPDATDEIRFNDRVPVCTLNPETAKPSIYSAWTRLRREEETRIHFLSGRRGGVGNLARFQADSAQYTGAPYADRAKVRAQTYSFRLTKNADGGNDELFFHFG